MKVILLIVGAAIIAVLGGILIFGGGGQNELGDSTLDPVDKNQGIFSLTFKDYEGNEVRLSDFAGTPMVINSWAVWCPFCGKELSEFAAVQKELGDAVVIIAIDRQESRAAAKKFSDELGVTDEMTFWLDSSDSFYRKIGGFSMPETIFINAAGETMDHKRGPMDAAEIKQRIQAIL